MKFILIISALVIGLIIWQWQKMKAAKTDYLSKEKKQKEFHKAEERRELRAEERIIEQRESIKHQADVEEADRQTKVERDIREAELRHKIQDRKDQEAVEEKRKIEENKENT